MAFFVAMITSIMWAFTYWRHLRLRALIPLAACLLINAAVVVICPFLFRAGFQRVLPRYQSVVQQVESGQFRVAADPKRIPLSTPPFDKACRAFARKETKGTVTVTFFWAAG